MQADSSDPTSTDPDRLHWDEHVARGVKFRTVGDNAQWDLGKLATEIVSTYGDSDLAKFADAIGVHYDALRDYEYVASRFAVRPANLVFGVLRQIAKRDESERADFVERATRERWTVSRARRETALAPAAAPTPIVQGSKSNIGFKASHDPIVTRFTNIASAFEALREDEEKDQAEPEQIAQKLTQESRRAIEGAIERATQFVDRWLPILEIELGEPLSEYESA